MGNQQSEDRGGIETNEFPDEFQCCVCLDLLHKPVVLACGHLACFWCVFKAMDTWQESHCPICRHPYHHFPSICQLLHFLLLKLYPLAYKRREKQVIEEEKKYGSSSPQFDEYLSESHSGDKKHPLIKESSDNIMCHKDCTITTATKSSLEIPKNDAVQENSALENVLVNGTCKPVSVADLLCPICKRLLYQPVVLNCGHVYCETCVINPSNDICRCQVCQSVHPNGFPKVCLVLDNFLGAEFSEEYATRKEALLKQANCHSETSSSCSKQASSKSAKDYSSLFSSQNAKVHIGVGCDYCGMWPILGNRYKCKDCVEKIGFDLCEGCYNSSSKLPGRFNQQHTPEHKFEILQPGCLS